MLDDDPIDKLTIDHARALAEPEWCRELLAAAIMPGQVVLLTVEHEADGGCCRTQPASLTLGIGHSRTQQGR